MDNNTTQDFSLPPVQPITGAIDSSSMPLQQPQVHPTSQPLAATPAVVPAAQPQMNARPSMQQAIAASLPISAEDKDLIERIWVDKAKMIVRQTYGDPFVQNKALSQVKADYIRKRYGKEIKVSE